MRDATSLLMPGYIFEAELVGHGACERYQIVCWACREAVFKGVLPRRDGRETHYFSHYRWVPQEQAKRCELRVGTLTKGDIDKAKSEARGQALALFVASFRDCLLRTPWYSGRAGRQASSAALARMEDRRLWREQARFALRVAREEWGEDGRGAMERHRADTVRFDVENGLETVWRAEAEGFAAGMVAHAMAPGSEKAWRALFTAAAALGLFVMKPSPADPFAPGGGGGSPDDRAVAAALDALLLTPDSRLPKVKRELTAKLYPFQPGQNMLSALLGRSLDNIPLLLMAVPFEDILRERAGLPPLAPPDEEGRDRLRGEAPPWPPVREAGEGDLAPGEIMGEAAVISGWSRRLGVTPAQVPRRTTENGQKLWSMVLPPGVDVDAEARRALGDGRDLYIEDHEAAHSVWFEADLQAAEGAFGRMKEAGVKHIFVLSGGNRVHVLACTGDRALAAKLAAEMPGAAFAERQRKAG
jgi:hypothetical protein